MIEMYQAMHGTITKRSQRIARYRKLTSFCFAVNGRVQEAKADGRCFCLVFPILLMTPHCAVFAQQSISMWKDVMGVA